MGRVCMGRVCYGPSLSWAEFVMGRVVQLPLEICTREFVFNIHNRRFAALKNIG